MKLELRLLLALPVLALGQNRGFSLEECQRIAVARDPQLASDSLSRESSRLQERSSRSGWLPVVGASVAYNRLSEVDNPGVELPLPAQLGGPRKVEIATQILDQYTSSLRVDQLLWDGFRLGAQARAARADQEGHDAARSKDQRDLQARVATAYWNLQASQAAFDAARRAADRADSQATFTVTAFRQGTALEQDTLQARLRVRQIELLLEQATASREFAQQTLATAMGLPLTQEIRGSDTLAPLAPVGGDGSTPRAEALQAAAATKSALSLEDAARAVWWPVVQASGQYDWNNPNARIFPNREQFDGSWRVGVAASWNLYRGGADDLAVRRADLAVRLARLREASLRDALGQELARRETEYRLARRRREIAALSLPLCQRDLDLARIRAQAGTALRLDAIDRASALAQAESDLAQAVAGENVAAANLSIARGALPRWK